MKKIFLLIVIFISISSISFSQQEMTSYLEEYRKGPYLDSLKKIGDYETYISELKSFQRIDNNFSVSLKIAYAYMHLNDTTNSLYYLQKAVEKGYQINETFSHFDTVLFAPIMSTIYSKKNIWEESYSNTLDILLLKELNKMILNDQMIRNLPSDKEENIILWRQIDSFNQARLKEIVQEKGWPDLTKRGHPRTGANNNQIEILIIHIIDVNDILYYLNLSIEACKHNKERWDVASLIMGDLLFRKDYPSKLRHLKINQDDGALDLEESALIIYSLASRLQGNPHLTINIRPCSNYKWDNPEIEILKLKEAIVKMGIDNHQVVASSPLIKMIWEENGMMENIESQIDYNLEKVDYQDDGLGEYYFIFEYPRNWE